MCCDWLITCEVLPVEDHFSTEQLHALATASLGLPDGSSVRYDGFVAVR
jgi:hypothetical protein